jgi:hypothetical protein
LHFATVGRMGESVENYRLVKHAKSTALQCPAGHITYNERHVKEGYCPVCQKYNLGALGPEAGPDELLKERGTK